MPTYGSNLVAFVDILGQRKKLLALESLGLPKDATTTVVPALRETARNVEVIRRTFRRSFKSLMNHPVSSNVPPQFRDRILKLRRFPYNLMGFADSVVISVPLDFREPTSAMMAATGLFATLKCVAIVMLNLSQNRLNNISMRGTKPRKLRTPSASQYGAAWSQAKKRSTFHRRGSDVRADRPVSCAASDSCDAARSSRDLQFSVQGVTVVRFVANQVLRRASIM